jgi:CRP/FNR family transcriptional regulator, cyclic AMP receptor protein
MEQKRWGSVRTKEQELQDVELFRACRPAELRRLAAAVEVAAVPAGTTLCRQGESGHECYVVASGEVDVLIDDVCVATLGPGEVVGELSLLDHGPRTATVVARTPLDLFVIPQRRFKVLMERVPSLGLALMVALSQRLRAVDTAVATG